MDTSTGGYLKTAGNRRLERAYSHVSALWFPVNPVALRRVHDGLQQGRYELSIDFLVDDLKSDLSLYLYCIREIVRQLQGSGYDVSLADPVVLFRTAGLPMIQKVLATSPAQISRHSNGPFSTEQAHSVQCTLISAATAEACAVGRGLDPNQAYFTAVLRQLGLTLISWNYPSIYEETLQALPEASSSLDELVGEKLGFTPLLLAMRVVQDWGLSRECVAALHPAPPTGATRDDGALLRSLCEVGEALARANQPDLYPSAAQDWRLAEETIRQVLGEGGVQVISQHLQKYWSGYRSAFGNAFPELRSLHAESKLTDFLKRRIAKVNRWLAQCEPLLQRRLREAYDISFREEGTAHKALRHLVQTALPVAGFSGVQIFSFDAGRTVLYPRLSHGECTRRGKTPLNVTEDPPENDPVAQSLIQKDLIRNDFPADSISTLAAPVGVSHIVGILYAEAPTPPPSRDMLTLHFRAVLQTLVDLLRLQ